MQNPIEKEINKVLDNNSDNSYSNGIIIQKRHTGFWIAAIVFIFSFVILAILMFLLSRPGAGEGALALAPILLGLVVIAVISLIYMVVSLVKNPPKQ